jgi:DNA-binding HxlR family transcriptional regulator
MSKQRSTCLIRGDGGRAVRGLLERIGEKWTLLVIATLDGEPLRFGELQQRIPEISQRMLTRTLRHLQRDGLVTRTSHPEVPPRVEYELTPLGRTLLDPAVSLAAWATVHNTDIEASRTAYDTQHP